MNLRRLNQQLEKKATDLSEELTNLGRQGDTEQRTKLIELKSENRQLAQHLKNMIEINSKDEAHERRVTERVQQLERQLMDQAN